MTQRKVYLTFVAVILISVIYLAIRFIMADWKVKLFLLSIAAAVKYITPLRSVFSAQVTMLLAFSSLLQKSTR